LGYGLALTGSGADLSPAETRELDAAIAKQRQGTLIIEAAPNTEVTVEQVRHEFWFGAALANQAFGGRMRPEDRDQYLNVFLTNFNSAVTENALKWHDMEPRRDSVNYATVDAMLAWTDEHQIPLRGHNIFWGIPNRVQDWLKTLPDAEFRGVLKARALDVGRRYRGRFAEYDLNNEMIHGNYYADRLGPGITLEMAQWVREGDPKAVLYLNDYDILTGRRLEDYITHIRGLLTQGVPIAGIGVQGHLHGDSFDPVALRNALDRLGEFRLPIRVTEFNFPGQRSKYYQNRGAQLTDQEEAAKARAIVDYYRVCFAHPRVEGILMWGFWEGANWIPVSSLYRRDWTPLPAAKAYRDLVYGEWWTRWQGKTDANGRCELRAFLGQHRVTAGAKELRVDLQPAAVPKVISLR
jgi:GH35 family endo-1,4-beta-xylanase